MTSATWLWIIPLLPLAGAAVNLFLGPRLGKGAVKAVGCGTVLGSFAFAVLAFLRLRGMAAGSGAEAHAHARPALTAVLGDWISIGNVHTDLGLLFDPLSAVMALVVTGVGFLIHVYSTAYMAGDARYSRYFAFLNLFTAAMLFLVLGDNLLLLFLGWEGVGLCSYLLIGFWFEERKNAVAGMKAFLVNRVGDYGFTIGMLLLLVTLGTATGMWRLDFAGLQEAFAKHRDVLGRGDPRMLLSVAGILLFVGAAGKSAQLPLHVWLPDAMAGPTPVSALIHAATMVTAGVYMVARMNFVYQIAPIAGEVVAVVGACTALFAATIALVQNDIKKVLAYSTISQLGYMFLGVGTGTYAVAGFGAGIFHLMTHAFFKACLFLGAGSVIHALHHALPHGVDPQDLRHMGGLRKTMPWTFWTFLIAALAIAGVPPLAGFFSKDEILWLAFSNRMGVPWFLGLVGACLTAFYMFRLVFLAFFGDYRGATAAASGHGPAARAEHDSEASRAGCLPKESPLAMTVPLVALAALAVVGGFVGVPASLGGGQRFEHWLAPVFNPLHAELARYSAGLFSKRILEWILMVLSVGMAGLGIMTAYVFYILRPDLPQRLAAFASGAYRVLSNTYYIDEFYQAAVVRPLLAFERLCAQFDLRIIDGFVDGFAAFWRGAADYSGWTDNAVVDGVVNGAADAISAAGRGARRLQTGRLRSYFAFSLLAALLGVLSYGAWAAREEIGRWVGWIFTL